MFSQCEEKDTVSLSSCDGSLRSPRPSSFLASPSAHPTASASLLDQIHEEDDKQAASQAAPRLPLRVRGECGSCTLRAAAGSFRCTHAAAVSTMATLVTSSITAHAYTNLCLLWHRKQAQYHHHNYTIHACCFAGGRSASASCFVFQAT